MTVDLANAHVFVDGMLVSKDVQRVVEAIRDYEPELDVKWIPPAARREGDAAFAIIHNPRNQPPYIMFYVQKDEDFDMRVLAKIIYNDQRNGKQNYSDFEAYELANKLIEKQKYQDALDQANDIALHVFKTKLNTYRIDENTVIQEGVPFNVARKHRKIHLT